MALEGKSRRVAGGADFRGRHFTIGANVVVTVIVATAIVVLLQWGSYYASGQYDLTQTGVNSLSAGTERLLEGLEQKVRLTSLYFETDLEEEDQEKYRSKIEDLLELYQSTNRTKVEVDFINPLKDFAERQALIKRLGEIEKFSEEIEPYKELFEDLREEKVGRINAFLQEQMVSLSALQTGVANEVEQSDIAQIQAVIEKWQEQLPLLMRDVEDAIEAPQPRFSTAKADVASLYSGLARDLKAISGFAEQLLAQRTGLTEPTRAYLGSVPATYQPLIEELERAAEETRELEPLELDDILRQLGDTSNALLVETEQDAKVVPFSEVWPAMGQGFGGGGFENRLFKGEQKLTAAILQLTQEEKTAVVFVRYGGPPLFFGGFPGQPMQAPYAKMRETLEDANFTVEEWDVASSETPPVIEPPPVRTIYVILRPNQPPQSPMQQQQQAPFDESHRRTVVEAMGEDVRAVFLAGWEPMGPGLFPAPYPYGPYLEDDWSIEVDVDTLILEAIGIGPETYTLGQQSFAVTEFSYGDHVLTQNLPGRVIELRLASPIEEAEPVAEGVEITPLLTCEPREGLWGVKQISPYLQKARMQEDIVKEPGDEEGPFTVAVAAEKGESKIVVIGSNDCMTDQAALAPVMMLTSRGFTLRQRNPGNVALFLNTLHWLNDNEQWMEVGQPAEFGAIEVARGPTLNVVRAFVVGVWPGLAICCGLVAWWVRRR